MKDIRSVRFACLLVCQSAIFIVSKGDGNRAAPWQEGKTMSTPSVTILKNLVLNWESNQMEEETIATFYRHWDGYPSRGLVLQHGEDDVSSFTLNPSWLSCEDETQRCIMVEIYLEP